MTLCWVLVSLLLISAVAFEPPLAVGAGSAIDRRHFIGVATVAIREPAAAAVLDSSMFDYIPRRFPNIMASFECSLWTESCSSGAPKARIYLITPFASSTI